MVLEIKFNTILDVNVNLQNTVNINKSKINEFKKIKKILKNIIQKSRL